MLLAWWHHTSAPSIGPPARLDCFCGTAKLVHPLCCSANNDVFCETTTTIEVYFVQNHNHQVHRSPFSFPQPLTHTSFYYFSFTQTLWRRPRSSPHTSWDFISRRPTCTHQSCNKFHCPQSSQVQYPPRNLQPSSKQ